MSYETVVWDMAGQFAAGCVAARGERDADQRMGRLGAVREREGRDYGRADADGDGADAGGEQRARVQSSWAQGGLVG